MKSDATTVDQYLTDVPVERLDALTRIRRLCLEHLDEFKESMHYGMPSYSRDGEVEVAFANHKNYIALYILRTEILDDYRDRFPKSSLGKGCIRYRNPGMIDFDIVEEMLVGTNVSRGSVC